MEYNEFFPYVNDYFTNQDWSQDEAFIEYLNTPEINEQYAGILMVTLPKPRMSYYQSTKFEEIEQDVLAYMDEIVTACGTFPVTMSNRLLQVMQVYSYALLFLGLVFNILLIIFVIISVLLIYSLLMIRMEKKTFDTGIMRLIGLTSGGFVAMILTQAVMFVIPSIISAYACAYPLLWLINTKLLSNELSDGNVSFVPGAVATVEAIGIGLLIPSLSAIIPI